MLFYFSPPTNSTETDGYNTRTDRYYQRGGDEDVSTRWEALVLVPPLRKISLQLHSTITE